VDKNATLG